MADIIELIIKSVFDSAQTDGIVLKGTENGQNLNRRRRTKYADGFA